MLNRDDMLEITRRMTLKRNAIDRIAGAYIFDGYIEGTFNTNFLKLSEAEKKTKLEIAKAIPFAENNTRLKEKRFNDEVMMKLLWTLNDCELKNDAILETLYEVLIEKINLDEPYGIFLFHNNYDIPIKGSDKASQWESELVYKHIILAVCPIDDDYNPSAPFCGFMYPALVNGDIIINEIAIYKNGIEFDL